MKQLPKLNDESYPHLEKRKPASYVEVMVINGEFKGIAFNGQKKWYHDLVGQTFLCTFSEYGTIRDFIPVGLYSSSVIKYRGFDPDDCMIL